MHALPVIALALFLVAVILLDRVALALMRPAHRPPGHTPDQVGLTARDWTVPGEPPLKGWWMRGEDPQGPVVILAHGWGANGAVVLPLARAAAPAAAWVVTYDVRGHGRSDRASMVSIRQFRDDALRAVEAASAEAPGRPVVLAGHSLGGAAAILAAAEGAPVAGLVLVATPFDVYGTIARYMREKGIPGHLLVPFLKPFWRARVGLPARRLHPGRRLRGITVPTLVIQPAEDSRVPPHEGERLARASRTAVALIPGAGHTDILEHPKVGELLREFAARVA